MQTRKSNDSGDGNNDDGDKRIVFKRVAKSNEPEAKASFQSSKLIMPEYQFGNKTRKKKNRPERITDGTIANKEIKLGHLMEDEIDE